MIVYSFMIAAQNQHTNAIQQTALLCIGCRSNVGSNREKEEPILVVTCVDLVRVQRANPNVNLARVQAWHDNGLFCAADFYNVGNW